MTTQSGSHTKFA